MIGYVFGHACVCIFGEGGSDGAPNHCDARRTVLLDHDIEKGLCLRGKEELRMNKLQAALAHFKDVENNPPLGS